jgi:hypothetical protein
MALGRGYELISTFTIVLSIFIKICIEISHPYHSKCVTDTSYTKVNFVFANKETAI